MASVNISIAGKTYRMACDDGQEERLHALALRLDQTIEELRGAFGEVGDIRLAVMAGIVMTDSLDEAEAKIEELQTRLQESHHKREQVSSQSSGSAIYPRTLQTVDAMARRAEELALSLEQKLQ
jgi:cell division protein ZapA